MDASTRSACSTSSAPANVHRGRWWTLRGRRNPQPPPVKTTEVAAKQAKTRSPLTDSTVDPLLTIEQRGGKGGQGREAAGTKAAQEEGIGRKGVTPRGRACPRWCSLSVPSTKYAADRI